MNDYILECKGLTKVYDRKKALDVIDLRLERGKIIGLLGPNGSGKTTLIKLANGLLTPTEGKIYIDGKEPGIETKKIISYLPDKNALNSGMKISGLIKMFKDFYPDFRSDRAYNMICALDIDPEKRLKTLSKGNAEKIQLILVMCREAELYLLDEPIGGVDPAARDYIISSIINNYNPSASVLISTHLIADVEKILDDVIFLKEGKVVLHDTTDNIRDREEKSVDQLFREVFRC
ncbi:MAG: ABC transporter ATP-binding protein [Clostridiales bacterium]|nr:ABC transporter ATP-binding protein [Clostridiales bacterium]